MDDTIRKQDNKENFFGRINMVIIYVKYKTNQINKWVVNFTINNFMWFLKQIYKIKPLKIVFQCIHRFFCKIKLITAKNDIGNTVLINKTKSDYSSYSNSFTSDSDAISAENLGFSLNNLSKKSKRKKYEKTKWKKKTKYSKELLHDLYGNTDDCPLTDGFDEKLYFRTTRYDVSSTFSDQAMSKIKEMEEEIVRLRRQIELVCHLKALQIEKDEELSNNKLKTSLNSMQNLYIPTPPPLPFISNTASFDDSTSIKTSKSCDILSHKSSRFDNDTLLCELQNIKLKHIEPIGRKKKFGSFLEEALHEKFKNVQLEDLSESEYSLSDWSD
uniref:PEHE domain-containing protein n=1 Tax=Strongyloides venezuelensis TaxID=75913 RepID=A0A0K0F9J6_STRVS